MLGFTPDRGKFLRANGAAFLLGEGACSPSLSPLAQRQVRDKNACFALAYVALGVGVVLHTCTRQTTLSKAGGDYQ
jgi:hypothetical protein